MKMASPEGTLMNMSPPTNSNPAIIQVLKIWAKLYTYNPWMITRITFYHCSTLKLHICRYHNILEEPESKVTDYESLGVSPNQWIPTISYSITWKASHEPTHARLVLTLVCTIWVHFEKAFYRWCRRPMSWSVEYKKAKLYETCKTCMKLVTVPSILSP